MSKGVTLRVQVPNNGVLTQKMYCNCLMRNARYSIIGHYGDGPVGFFK